MLDLHVPSPSSPVLYSVTTRSCGEGESPDSCQVGLRLLLSLCSSGDGEGFCISLDGKGLARTLGACKSTDKQALVDRGSRRETAQIQFAT